MYSMGDIVYYFWYAEEITEVHTKFTGDLRMDTPLTSQLVTGSLSDVFEYPKDKHPKECLEEIQKAIDEKYPDRALKVIRFNKV